MTQPNGFMQMKLDQKCESCGHRFGNHAMRGCQICIDADSRLRGPIPGVTCLSFKEPASEPKPDWGHGPNQPVTQYTLAEISEVLREVLPTMGGEAQSALIIEKLRRIR